MERCPCASLGRWTPQHAAIQHQQWEERDSVHEWSQLCYGGVWVLGRWLKGLDMGFDLFCSLRRSQVDLFIELRSAYTHCTSTGY